MTHLPDPRCLNAEQHAKLFDLARQRAIGARDEAQRAFWAGIASAVDTALTRALRSPRPPACPRGAR